MQHKTLDEKERYFHRDLSWLAFNERVMEEAQDAHNPLLERLKFLAIFVSNLDEFFMVRLAGLKNVIHSGINNRDLSGYYPQELWDELKPRVDGLTKKLYDVYQTQILPEMNKQDIFLKSYADLKKEQKKHALQYFETTLFPILTPMAVDPGHPFPVLPSKTLAFAVNVGRKGEQFLAIIPIPKNIPRLYKLPTVKSESSFILVEDLIGANLETFFRGYKISDWAMFRVIRDGELSVDEEFTPNLLKAIEDDVKNRRRARTVYVEMEKDCTVALREMVCQGLHFPMEELVLVENNLDLGFLAELSSQVDKPELRYPGYVSAKEDYDNIFDRIKAGDMFIHMPYQSFQPTIDLIETAARDPQVLAIKMTLYRTNQNSAIIQALKDAAKNRKQVTVLVEIKARFEEETNIRWVKELEDVGCHVIYGIPGLKVHAKMTLIVRQEDGRIQRYVHLSTGNYNEITAKVYTDFGYFTANEDFARDISEIFNVVTGYSMPSTRKRIVTSPHDLRDYFFMLIEKEIMFQRKHQNGFIQAKMNSLEDFKLIDKLYEASCEGVKINLLVRGICSLVPGVKGMSENIEVRSIVGRFLEHSRMFVFHNNGSPRVFVSSGDWMCRNMDRRIELLFEIYKDDIKRHLVEILDFYWKDTRKTRILGQNKTYARVPALPTAFNAQEYWIQYYAKGQG